MAARDSGTSRPPIPPSQMSPRRAGARPLRGDGPEPYGGLFTADGPVGHVGLGADNAGAGPVLAANALGSREKPFPFAAGAVGYVLSFHVAAKAFDCTVFSLRELGDDDRQFVGRKGRERAGFARPASNPGDDGLGERVAADLGDGIGGSVSVKPPPHRSSRLAAWRTSRSGRDGTPSGASRER
jgi:hypothetical protein